MISKHRRVKRVFHFQQLESRRLLVAEGSVFAFNGEFDAGGVVGDVSAQVRWGDGTTSPVTSLSGGNATGNLRIRLDYSLDTGGFFASSSRRALLQIAADSLVQRFGDELAPITPGGIKQWEPSVFHPSSGPANQILGTSTPLPKNLNVAANEIIVYAGARDLPGANRGVGGPASVKYPAVQLTCQTQAECDQKLAEIEAFRDTVRSRGQPGALASPQTDVAPHIGSVSFDNKTDWFFGTDAGGIGPGQVDFLSAAVHEFAHVLGFGLTSNSSVTSWQRLTSSGVLAGQASRAAYQGNGNPPVELNHWSPVVLDQAGQRTLMAAEIATGRQQLFTTLDFAAMKDLGWEVLDTRATVSAEHRFPDDGVYPVDLVLKGARGGEVVHRVNDVSVTNVAPTLTVAANRTATVGEPFTITDIAALTDPGFTNNDADPGTSEVFEFTIDWGDGSALDRGTATIDAAGNATGTLTRASLDGTHTYATVGRKTVTIRVTDDDGGSSQKSFAIDVDSPPALTLELDKSVIGESDGGNAATLTIRRSGPARGTNQTINLSSNDPTEATVPPTAVIPANATSVTVPITAIDDALLDGDIVVRLAAEGVGVESGDIELLVQDRESLSASFSSAQIREDAENAVDLVIRRSNTDDLAGELAVMVSGGDTAALDAPSIITIPDGQQQVLIKLLPNDDDDPQPTRRLAFTFAAEGYLSASAVIDLLDDEPPRFQNPRSRFDVDDNGLVTAGDALRIINQLTIRGGASDLDPRSEQPDGVFFDPNGDYRITALDALQVINEVGRLLVAQSANSEIALPIRNHFDHRRDDDRDRRQPLMLSFSELGSM